jgi:hypothetical protein
MIMRRWVGDKTPPAPVSWWLRFKRYGTHKHSSSENRAEEALRGELNLRRSCMAVKKVLRETASGRQFVVAAVTTVVEEE